MNDPFDYISDGAKHLMDALSLAALLGTLVSWLPSVAVILTIIWTLIRIYETDTIRGLTGRERP